MTQADNMMDHDKKVAFYQTVLAAWVQNRMELSKQVLILATLGIGLLTSFHSEIRDCLGAILWVSGIVCFLIAMFASLQLFRWNADYLEQINIKKTSKARKERLNHKIKCCSKLAKSAFVVGVLLSCSLVLTLTLPKLEGEKIQMSENDKKTQGEPIEKKDISDIEQQRPNQDSDQQTDPQQESTSDEREDGN